MEDSKGDFAFFTSSFLLLVASLLLVAMPFVTFVAVYFCQFDAGVPAPQDFWKGLNDEGEQPISSLGSSGKADGAVPALP